MSLALIVGFKFSPWYGFLYLLPLYLFYNWRKALKEKERLLIAHRIPFFADALANTLSVGMTLEQAFEQSAYFLKGPIKEEFNSLMFKQSLGKDLGALLRDIDSKFPDTGLRYLISLLDEYRNLGVGISPLLKKIAEALTLKEEAEDKIRTILAAGSSYARLSIGLFCILFFGMTYILKDQVALLATSNLKPYVLFLMGWACLGIVIVGRMTSMDFTRNFALRPYIKNFLQEKTLPKETLLRYSGIEWNWWKRKLLDYAPMIIGFITTYFVSWYQGSPLILGAAFAGTTLAAYSLVRYVLQSLVEDQLLKAIETFPDILQVFVIGLNSGLNTYQALRFADNAVKNSAPKLLVEELCRAKFAMECGEEHRRTWQRFAETLPFEIIIDFCEIMVIAPLHGESIVRALIQMINGYQLKKMTLIEKKAISLGQLVIPIIVIAFFPLFLFTIFAPLISRITHILNG